MRSGTRKTINLAAMVRPNEPHLIKERDRSGRYRTETPTEIRALMVNARLKLGVPVEHTLDQKAGSRFGRLLLHGEITDSQYAVGLRFEAVCVRYATVMGYGSPHPKSPSTGSVGGSRGDAGKLHTAEEIAAAKTAYDEMFHVLNYGFEGKDQLKSLKDCILLNEVCHKGHLRSGLNVLAVLWR